MTPANIKVNRINRTIVIVIVLLVLVAIGIAGIRLHTLGVGPEYILPKRIHTLTIEQRFNSRDDNAELSVFIPQDDFRQQIVSESHSSENALFETAMKDGNRIATWRLSPEDSQRTVSYVVKVQSRAVRYEISNDVSMEDLRSYAGKADTEPSKEIQSTAPEIRRLAKSLTPGNGRGRTFLWNVFQHVRVLGFKPFKGTTDALTALRLKEASCNGKSRLMVAILRAAGIGARLAGGIVMNPGTKRTSHQWVEVYSGSTWIPMDPTNNHFGEIPADYVTLYRGDFGLFRHSSDISFDYQFRIQRDMVPPQEIDETIQVMGFWQVFKKLGIDADLLKSISMIPLGALIVVFFRNVIGLSTFGTFLPVLIAVACRNTGILWGLIGFTSIIFIVSLTRRMLDKLQLLHSPLLAILLTIVVALLLASSAIGVTFDLPQLARVALFPMVVVAITSERFALMEIEEDSLTAWKTMVQTLIVVSVCYLVIQSLTLQIIVLGFPETLLIVVALNVWIGRWVGLRAGEWLRFRGLLFQSRRTS